MMTDMGGVLGLWLGLAFFSTFECFEFLTDLVVLFVTSRLRRQVPVYTVEPLTKRRKKWHQRLIEAVKHCWQPSYCLGDVELCITGRFGVLLCWVLCNVRHDHTIVNRSSPGSWSSANFATFPIESATDSGGSGIELMPIWETCRWVSCPGWLPWKTALHASSRRNCLVAVYEWKSISGLAACIVEFLLLVWSCSIFSKCI